MTDLPQVVVKPAEVAARLLGWYDRHRRDLPWRAPPGARMPAYRVWLSEIMLQQTTVATVAAYYRAFLGRWPTVHDLAAADLDAVLAAWQGLGYYARARNLHACAKAVAHEHGGRFPDDEAGLRALPGIGAYTAAAVAAIAFDRKATPVDGNVERVVARLFRVTEPMPASKPALRRLAATLTPAARPGDFAQAMMDLGATVCAPRRPACDRCPLTGLCAAEAAGDAATLPARSAKPARPLRHGHAFVAFGGDGTLLLRRRPERGMLGGMMEPWCGPWRDAADHAAATATGDAPFAARWRELPGVVEHGFTHFSLELTVHVAEATPRPLPDSRWQPLDRLHEAALPTVMKKVLRRALDGRGGR